ncbi:hypothetical protein Pan216_50630 [Planctomycetes bacterium Pan216]|uniref:Imelysin n=1 Tax=Kolteria novifilia TaxID=2527975 RepID=A0A518BB16_9BACT|nr:hypothetical protein Pan216_50630 [Planctomycetes bacterium Pan216]
MPTSHVHGVCATLLLLVAPIVSLANEADTGDQGGPAKEILPADVLVEVDLVRQRLQQLRSVMGRPENRNPDLFIEGAAPREVYFQALTLFRKADRLCAEHTAERFEAPEPPVRNIRSADVFQVVSQAGDRIDRVRQSAGIDEDVSPAERDPTTTPDDVFRSIVQANRQLNLLLDRQVSPSDVFEEVTFGIGYAASILATFPGSDRIPEAPAFEGSKRPANVYQRLVDCFARIRKIAQLSGLDVLELRMDEEVDQEASPSDVFDIASLLVSELAFIHSQLPDAKPPRRTVYPGRKFPSHVYQRVGILERQLIELEKWVGDDPNWLKRAGATRATTR